MVKYVDTVLHVQADFIKSIICHKSNLISDSLVFSVLLLYKEEER